MSTFKAYTGVYVYQVYNYVLAKQEKTSKKKPAGQKANMKISRGIECTRSNPYPAIILIKIIKFKTFMLDKIYYSIPITKRRCLHRYYKYWHVSMGNRKSYQYSGRM